MVCTPKHDCCRVCADPADGVASRNDSGAIPPLIIGTLLLTRSEREPFLPSDPEFNIPSSAVHPGALSNDLAEVRKAKV